MLKHIPTHIHVQILASRKAHVILSMTLRHFAISVSSIFVPLFLYDIGYSLAEVALFFVGMQIMRALLFLPVIKTIERFGIHHTITLSYLFAGIYMLGLYIAQWNAVGIWIALLFGPAMEVFYWGAAHIDIAGIVTKAKMSRNIGIINSLTLISQAAAPIVGGIVAATAGPGYTLLLSFAILIFATAALHSEINHERNLPKKDFVIRSPDAFIRRNMLSNFFGSVVDVTGWMIWPIYIFLLLGGFDTVGYVVGLGILVSIVLINVVGRRIDSHPRIFTFGIFNKIVTFPLRFLATTSTAVFAANTYSSLNYAFFGIPWGSYYHRNAKYSPVNYVFWVEFVGELGKLCSWLILLVFLSFMSDVDAARYTVLAVTPLVGFAFLIRKPPPSNN